MLFLFRAVFWVAVVAAFTPPGFTLSDGAWTERARIMVAEAIAAPSPDADAAAPVRAPEPGRTAGAGLCADQPEVCRVAGELGRLGLFLGEQAALRIEAALAAPDEAERERSA